MRSLLSLFLLPLFLFSTEIKIASYNVENLFDMVKNGTEYDAYVPNKHNWKRSILKKKLLHLSEVICDINADIIGLQEVENDHTLQRLKNSLRKVGCPYPYSAITHKSKSAIQVALLSKLPIQNSKEIVVNRKLGYRNILEVKMIIEDKPLYLFVNHWRSKRAPESKRLLSARGLKRRIEHLPKGADYILLGDFNSDYDEYRDMKPQHNDTEGKTGVNHILKTLSHGHLVQEKAMKTQNLLHYNLWLELPNFQRWSHNFYGDKQGLDAMILPSSLFDGKGWDYVNDSFEVVKAPYLFHKKGYINRWQYKRKRHLGEGYSDHLPIVAHFSTSPYVFQNSNCVSREAKIEELYKDKVKLPIVLKDIKVIFKSKYHAIIKESREGRAIFVYGADGLKEGERYDLVVNKTKRYKGLDEVLSFSVVASYGETSLVDYFYRGKLNFSNDKLVNEVAINLMGYYANGGFYHKGKAYKIYFKNRDLKPKNGTRLKLHRVQIGYYDTMQLVVWGAEDFTILE